MQPSITRTSAMKRYGSRAGWSLVVLGIACVLGVGWVKWHGPLERRLTEWTSTHASGLALAARAYDRGEWEKAAELTRRLLKSYPDDPETLRIYARASARTQREAAAMAIYQNRLGTTPLQAEDFYLLGLLNARAGNLEAALDFWQKSAQHGPDNPELLDSLARLLARLQRVDEAAATAKRLTRQPLWEARGFLLVGEIRVLLEDRKGAVDALGRGLELDPGAKGALQPPSYFRKMLARSLLQLGRPADARLALEAMHASNAIGGVDPEAEWLKSRAWLQEGKLTEAATALALAGSYRAENPLIPEPSPFVGEASCVACHRKESRSHEKSRHARTFHRGRGLLALPIPNRPLTDPDDSKATHTFGRDKDKVKVETRAGDKVYQLVVDYAFGVSDRYVTMIGRDDEGAYRVMRLSSYHGPDGVAWGRTSLSSPDLNAGQDVRGDSIPVRDGVVRCLYCHVTYPRDFREPPPATEVGPEVADSAIGCERCHGPGGNHLKAIQAGFSDNSIVNAGTRGARAIGELCADCHIVDQIADIQRSPEEPAYVRSPGLTLTFSRCFSESDGGMSCLTCHNAHRDDQEPPSFYEAKCLTCHASQAVAPKPAAGARAGSPAAGQNPASACPVSPGRNCLECHMPKVPVPDLHTGLTDHYIRVHDRSKTGGR
jgi:tetratricopeptide (TPR) repeat protein